MLWRLLATKSSVTIFSNDLLTTALIAAASSVNQRHLQTSLPLIAQSLTDLQYLNLLLVV
jgi:hypothetical protein